MHTHLPLRFYIWTLSLSYEYVYILKPYSYIKADVAVGSSVGPTWPASAEQPPPRPPSS